MLKKIRVFVVDDSIFFRQTLINDLKSRSNLEVVGFAASALEARTKIPTLKPDVITMDVEMPGLSGIDFLKELLPKYPIPVILVSSLNLSVFDALHAGAVDFVQKPNMAKDYNVKSFFNVLNSKIFIASRAKVNVKPSQPGKPQTASSASAAPVGGATAAFSSNLSQMVQNTMLIAIGASTGGTEATLEVLQRLPADMPGIVVTQHMPEGFTKMYAERLNRICKLEVKEAENGDRVRRGLVLIAPGGALQMRVEKDLKGFYVSCQPGEKVNGHRPSVDVLFSSVAKKAGKNAVGIIMTGMGRDGASGLLEMRKAGAFTIGQDKESCVVYGMPMVAYEIGGVCTQASCTNISNVLLNQLRKM
ncbi:MAG: chemotaxis response regulator protein-glutamate methylesterase [Lachnospiraceae bacterium]|jgi:two-component system chemotaxis response regulator CheB|nr:chemotaxis response regulator protein-glutamate methylesterase [Lachnospiraceae bacterium]